MFRWQHGDFSCLSMSRRPA